ncbi:hypothetical protein COO91_00598 [Nostoc flagelliforme CCNUN1]|uniref:Uncharacterized protein n=1 Tax=Nostoc flagelliforme CCNUN1 TaxID=2038116 RepID=A0A2K8SH63_9NOSO|nr:hypothetical protein COO91_00598 [Nostoc flagelliforme CCNUN1]
MILIELLPPLIPLIKGETGNPVPSPIHRGATAVLGFPQVEQVA